MKNLLLSSISLLSLIVGMEARANFTSEIYELNSGRKNLLYKGASTLTEKDGVSESKTIFTDPAGAVVVEEIGVFKGSTLIRYDIKQKQMNVDGTVSINGDVVNFKKTEGGKDETADEKFKSAVVIAPTFSAYVKDNWAELLKGKTVSFRFASWERMETVGFDIKKSSETTIDGKPAVVVKMSASSFIIAAIVNPMYFTYSADGNALLEMKGRVPPKKKVDAKWKDLDAEVVYHWQ